LEVVGWHADPADPAKPAGKMTNDERQQMTKDDKVQKLEAWMNGQD
jgi:hypothetical protein